ncbi:MAG: hypothetical protein K1060chlam4_00026 [Candidatus Anoxychlamydiales bacterium]|nr:hypothetical protein [Candidatus Anoxychlamydiales bacterium]
MTNKTSAKTAIELSIIQDKRKTKTFIHTKCFKSFSLNEINKIFNSSASKCPFCNKEAIREDFIENKDLDEANNLISTLQGSLEKINNSLNHYFEAKKYFENDSFQKAHRACTSGLDLNIENQIIDLALSKLLAKIKSKLNKNSDSSVTEAEEEFKDEIQKYEDLIKKQILDQDKCESHCLAKTYNKLASAWSRWGDFLYDSENFHDAEEKYNNAIEKNSKGLDLKCNDLDLNIQRAHFVNSLGLIYKNQTEFSKALSKFEEAIKLYEESIKVEEKKNSHSLIVDNIKEYFAKTYINISNTNKDLGNSYYSSKKYREALLVYNKAILMIQKSLEIFVSKYAYLDLSYLYECAGNAVRMLNAL